MWYTMAKETRRFVSIYFEDGLKPFRNKRDVTLAFKNNDALYERCKQLGSSKIKRLIGIESYQELTNKAKEDGRSVSNYVKHYLRKSICE